MVILWLGALLAALPLLPRVPGRLSAGGFSDPLLPAAQAEVTLRQELGLPANTMAVFYRSPGRPYADPAGAGSRQRPRCAGCRSYPRWSGWCPRT